jgi:hypothetical protein
MPDKTPTIFISYSRKDHACLEELLKAVKPTLVNVTGIRAWADDDVESGEHWDAKIRQALDAARAALLLISNDFLNSRYIREEELPVLLPREQNRSLRLFTVPRAEADRAQRSAMAWLEGVLSDDRRLDPVSALHANGHAFAACRAAYQQWDPQLGEAHLDEDLAHLLLDRTRQRSRLLQARDDFFDLSSKLRVQCFLAVGTSGNRVGDFPQQAFTHLQIHAKPGVHAYLCHVELQPTDTDPDRLETRYRRRLGLRPSRVPAEGLRPAQVRHSNEYLLPLLAWTLAGEATAGPRTAVARAIVRWSRERLAVALIREARDRGWHAMKADLQNRS